MAFSSLRLQQFRSYGDASFAFDDGVNIIVGPNASGKTNILEAVLVAALGGSYRARDSELIKNGTEWARIDAVDDEQTRIVKIQPGRAGTVAKSFELDDQTFVRLHASRTLPVVLFEPNHLLLLTGSPELRRAFLDDLLEQLELDFGPMRRQYRRVLTQRNALLKQRPRDVHEQLFVWNLRLSELGGRIAQRRLQLLAQINERASEHYGSLAGGPHKIALEYMSSCSAEQYESSLLKRLEASEELDILRGFTGTGPHRDDIAALIDGRPMAEVASRGELRTLVLVLKILELQLLKSARAVQPMLLLDDVFSELDAKRRQALTGYVRDYQTFITTTDADVATHHFSQAASIIPL